MEPLAVDVREAARLTSLSPHTIRAYIRSGRMLAVRIGRRVLIEPREIKRLIVEGRDYTPDSDWRSGGRQ
jgi:excisionase family DNA binding protein